MCHKICGKAYSIKKSGVSDEEISGVASIHRQEISQGFLSSLGHAPLSMFFTFASKSKFGVLHVANSQDEGKPVGFVLGAIDTGKFYKEFLAKKSFRAFFLLLPKVISFEKLRKIMETLVYPSKNKYWEMPKAELLDIAITKEHQGVGLAQLLFQSFSDRLSEMEIDEFKITTGESLVRAQRFYEKLGAQKAGEVEVHKGEKTYVYRYKIPKLQRWPPQ
ncbi:MAG: GNAT family N-acetyltransferase [Deltaproteobacteria bacterium]|nr:GNAT family N-acetyltransferase [Deltaproteobacteria bacterium]